MGTIYQIGLADSTQQNFKLAQRAFFPLLKETNSVPFRTLLDKIFKATSHLRLCGELGTEIESIAHHIHIQNSTQPFFMFNALNQNIAQLFEKSKETFFEQEGALYIAHIDQLDASLQEKLSEKILQSKIRLIGMSHMNHEIPSLHPKLNAFFKNTFFEVLPLRSRKEDLPLLIQHFLKSESTLKKVHGIQSDALKVLFQYNYPGNLLELYYIISRAAMTTTETSIQLQDIPQDIRKLVQGVIDRNLSLDEQLALEEKNRLVDAIKKCKGNKTKVAQYLKISRRNLYRKLFQHGLA